jgi:phosphomannomutase
MSRIKFGTDGWRAVIAEDFTFANVARVAQATADYWSANPVADTEKKVVVGYDRRFLSDEFARCAAEVFAGNSFSVALTPEPTPTPSVSFAVKEQRAIGGVMITASHNPPMFNGFKLKSHYGGSSDSATCQAVESFLDRNPVRTLKLADAIRSKQIVLRDVRPAHYAALKRLVDFKLIAKSKLRFAHEALFGVGAGCFERLLAGTSCKVTTLNGNHDPLFGGINPEPIENRHGRGRVVKALTTTSMVDKICAAHGLALTETGVGFKYICSEMLKGGVLLGAEESGGIGFPGHIPERDGIAAGLFLLEMLATERVPVGRLLAGLEKEFGPHRYGRIDTHFPLEKRGALMEFLENNPPNRLLRSPVTDVRTYDGVKFIAEDTSWLMLRGSGTEPILRIYAEAKSDADVRKLLQSGVVLTRKV